MLGTILQAGQGLSSLLQSKSQDLYMHAWQQIQHKYLLQNILLVPTAKQLPGIHVLAWYAANLGAMHVSLWINTV